jgi:REP-associated tyrosine transposase
MSHVHRLRITDRIFFVTVNLRRVVSPLEADEFELLVKALEGARRRLEFLLGGYVLMPDHWHVLIGVRFPLTISEVLHDVKKVSARRLHQRRETEGAVGQHQFWDRFVRHGREFHERLEYMRWNPVRQGLVKRPEGGRWSRYNNFAVDHQIVAACPVEINYVRLPEGYRV